MATKSAGLTLSATSGFKGEKMKLTKRELAITYEALRYRLEVESISDTLTAESREGYASAMAKVLADYYKENERVSA